MVQSKGQNKSQKTDPKKWIFWQMTQNNHHKDAQWAQENDVQTKWLQQWNRKYKKEPNRILEMQ